MFERRCGLAYQVCGSLLAGLWSCFKNIKVSHKSQHVLQRCGTAIGTDPQHLVSNPAWLLRLPNRWTWTNTLNVL